jgi:hypothetical protein
MAVGTSSDALRASVSVRRSILVRRRPLDGGREGVHVLACVPRASPDRCALRGAILVATFADRIPSAQRADAARILASWGVEHPDDPFEVLAKRGGLRATDRIELAEYRAVDDPLVELLEFRVAGMKHVPPDSRSALGVGATLKFEREPSNPHDPYATIVARTADGMRAGYVPRQYSAMIARLLDLGVALDAVAIRELVLPDDAPRWVVRASRASGS